MFSCAGSSIITVAETLPRGATSLLSVSFSPPKLLILKSACRPCPQTPPIPHRPSQRRDAGRSQRSPAQPRRVWFFPKSCKESSKAQSRSLSAKPGAVAGEFCRAEPPSRSSAQRGNAAAEWGKHLGTVRAPRGLLPGTRTSTAAQRGWRLRVGLAMTQAADPHSCREASGAAGRDSGSCLCPRRTLSPARSLSLPAPPALANLVWGNFLSFALSAAMSESGGAPGCPRHLLFGPAVPARRGGQGSGGRGGGGVLPSSLRL